MKIIAHRGNLHGKNIDLENNPEHIMSVIELGLDVEADIWLHKNNLYLGHDMPQYKIKTNFLSKKNIWFHAKNIEVIPILVSKNTHWFWHQTDKVTITSKGYIWCYPGHEVDGAIMVDYGQKTSKNILGICTDNPMGIK